MLEKFHAFITLVTTVHTLSLSQATWIHSTPSKVFSLTYVLMLSSHVCLVFPTSLLQVFYKNCVCTCFLPYTCHMPCQSIFPDLITLIMYSEQYQSWSSLLCIFVQPPATASLFSTNISFSTIVSPTPHLYSSFTLRDYFHAQTKQCTKW